MQKYNIEDNIDFFSELNKLLNKENLSNETLPDETNVCLISNENLTDYFVKLNCGHSFNYVPLFKDIVNQKKKFNSMEIIELNKHEIRCPYCRTTQQSVLPYYEELGLPKINGVNTIEKEKINLCEYSIPNLNFNPMLPEDDNIGNVKVIVCLNVGTKIAGKNYGDTKHYCSYHKKIAIHYAKEEMKLLKAKASEEQKQEKIKKQMLKISNKATEKNKQPNIKHLVAENESNQNNENVIIQNNVFYDNIVIDLSGNIGKCKQKLKTGINKDKECGCKIFMDNLCKRHYNLSKK